MESSTIQILIFVGASDRSCTALKLVTRPNNVIYVLCAAIPDYFLWRLEYTKILLTYNHYIVIHVNILDGPVT